MIIEGNIVDIHNKTIYFGRVVIENRKIKSISPLAGESDQYILPPFVDAHVHIESSMLVPSEFARLAVVHGTVATVSDPHEIANVLGMEGVHYMIDNGKQVPFKFYFGAPSCVPATQFETAGAELSVEDVNTLLNNPDIVYLAEMMNYPGVLFKDEMVMAKIAAAKKVGKPIDGHAPGLRGEQAQQYASEGISTDHECFTYEEAKEKIGYGMKILIREGSAAKNFEALIPLLAEHPDRIMFCSDDKHPDDLIEGHINQLVARALEKGHDLFDILRAATLNPVDHYGLEVGLLRVGDLADFIVTKDLKSFEVERTFMEGVQVSEKGKSLIHTQLAPIVNNFHCQLKSVVDFRQKSKGEQIQVIQAIDGEIVTEQYLAKAKMENGYVVSDIEKDILKITVINRYQEQVPAIAFINGFGLKEGAIASCVGHDSHNIIAVGVDDESLTKAVNLIIKNKGGIAAVGAGESSVLPLPIAGIMSNADGYEVAKAYAGIDAFVKKELACVLTAPFMTLSFMALLVIPKLKLSDKGLFDGEKFSFTNLYV